MARDKAIFLPLCGKGNPVEKSQKERKTATLPHLKHSSMPTQPLSLCQALAQAPGTMW